MRPLSEFSHDELIQYKRDLHHRERDFRQEHDSANTLPSRRVSLGVLLYKNHLKLMRVYGEFEKREKIHRASRSLT